VTAAVPRVGSAAPDFTARTQHGEPFRLSEYRDRRPVVLVFYPYAFSRVCGTELGALRDRPDLLAVAEFVAISCDPMFTLRAYAESERLEFPLLSDFWPHGEIAAQYGVFDAERGCAGRGTFVIDENQTIVWSVLNPFGEARNPDDYAEALAKNGSGLG
jgi:peroxiredoxin